MKQLKLLKKEQGNLNTVYDIEVADAHHYMSSDGIIMHNSIGSFFPGQTIAGGGGAIYNASVILQLSKAGLKEGGDDAAAAGVQKTGIIVTSKPAKNRFARPIPVKFHISFYKGMNPYVGLETFLTWENCGIQKGKLHNQKVFDKFFKGKPNEAEIAKTRFVIVNENGVEENYYLEPKETARTIVVRHLGAEIKPSELFTPRVINESVLRELDEKIIKKMFMLPNIADLSELEDTEIADDVLEIETNED